jgi:1-acyl-sn-glycerol-3-phosphate acyltransferase
MSLKWLLSWIVIFPLLKFLTGVEINGSVPKHGAVILACNHVSFLDPPAVGITACREVYFLAKPGLFRLSKFFTWLITSYNALSIGGTEGIRKAIRLLKRGNAVVIFPEGTRIRTGIIESFNPGVGYLAISLGIPVIPVYIKNSNKKFISLIVRLNRLKVIFGQPLYPSGYKKGREDFEHFAAKIREAIMNLQ